MKLAAMRSRLRSREISTRKHVGDIVSLVSEEGNALEDANQEL